jgi:hypothetical protein
MSDSTVPGPAATGQSRGGVLHFWLVMTISLIWVFVPPAGAPGTDRHGPPSILCPCPECGRVATRQLTGLYECDKHHNSRLMTDGSRRCDHDQAAKALSADSEQSDKGLSADSEQAG